MTQPNTVGPEVYRMPYEQGSSESPETTFAGLAGSLFGDENPSGVTEEQSEPAAEAAEPEVEEVEESEDESAEESDEEEQDDSEDEEPTPKAELVEVTVDGKKVQVTLDELKKGYSFTAHNTRKSQELAEQRKALEAEAAQTREAREKYSQHLALLEQALQKAAPAEPDWDKLERENPTEFARQWATKQRRDEQFRVLQAEQERIAQERQAEFETQYTAQLDAERARLVEAIPEWKEPTKAAEGKRALKQYAVEQLGFTEEQVAGVTDHRVMVILRKSMLYDQLAAKGQEQIQAKAKTPAPRVLEPGTVAKPKGGKDKEIRALKNRLAQTGDVNDAAAVFRRMIS